MTLRLAIFDVDGTLVDSQNHIHGAMRHAFEARGHVCPPRAEVLSIVGLSLPQAVARLVPQLAEDERLAIVQAYKDSFGLLRAEGPPPLYPGVAAMLDDLAARELMLLGVATGKSRRGLRLMIEAHGLEGIFVTQQTADTHPSKPHPSMIETALAEAGVDAAEAVMIGDTTYDIEMGVAAGVATIGVSWGYHAPAALVAAGAGQIVQHAADLPGAIDAAFAARV